MSKAQTLMCCRCIFAVNAEMNPKAGYQETVYWCHRYPPKATEEKYDYFPLVKDLDWCGEFKVSVKPTSEELNEIGGYPMEHRGFFDMTENEIQTMSERMENAAADYAGEIGVSGLSMLGFHNVYEATTQMLIDEWNKSKKAVVDWQIENMEDRL